MQALQLHKRRERRRDVTQEPLGNRTQIKDVAILRHRGEERLRGAQSRRRLPQPQQLAYALNFLLSGNRIRT
jgi:hypothetical protein